MHSWFSQENWPPTSQRGLNPVVNVEDLSMMMAETESSAFLSYQRCHFTPDSWRNYTVIGTQGRLENLGDSEGGHVKPWNRRVHCNPDGDAQFPIHGDEHGHEDADIVNMREFLEFVRFGTARVSSPPGAWYAVAMAIQATDSIRDGSRPHDVPQLPGHIVNYFRHNQVKSQPTPQGEQT